ncbi:hypothetical protein NDU88_010299 [Pleurodeles waltl]|uniref:Uncharacterized protein n=1 Tax=Pleurodeles waltl TaxID=8319 RepID=A0AAV7QU02_PLEWA|nr:hypothetical protein NDU88_010299 [Pleurodeles waltl]
MASRERSRKGESRLPWQPDALGWKSEVLESHVSRGRASLLAARERSRKGESCLPWQQDALGWKSEVLASRVSRGARPSYGRPREKPEEGVPSSLATRRSGLEE